MDNDYIYKRLDNASLGHEADKAWVLDNIQNILDMIDRYDLNKQEVSGLQERIDDLEEQLWNEEANTARLEDEVAELLGEVHDLKHRLAGRTGRGAVTSMASRKIVEIETFTDKYPIITFSTGSVKDQIKIKIGRTEVEVDVAEVLEAAELLEPKDS